jgi:hypothetical protein
MSLLSPHHILYRSLNQDTWLPSSEFSHWLPTEESMLLIMAMICLPSTSVVFPTTFYLLITR